VGLECGGVLRPELMRASEGKGKHDY